MEDALLMRLGPDDMAAVAELEARCFTSPWGEKQLRAALASPYFIVYGLKGQERLRAYVSLSMVPGEIEVLNIATQPGERRRGLARFLLRRALETTAPAVARGDGARVFLEVRVGNAPALGLYRSLGFARVGIRKGYYRDTGEDALVLSLNLSGAFFGAKSVTFSSERADARPDDDARPPVP